MAARSDNLIRDDPQLAGCPPAGGADELHGCPPGSRVSSPIEADNTDKPKG
jgi:hypothetical protein